MTRMTRWAPLLLLGLLACRPPDAGGAGTVGADTASQEGLRVSLELPDEPALGPAELLIYVLGGADGVSEATVTVTGNMTHAGMEPVIAEAVESETGLYRTQDFRFTMAGDWLLSAEVTLPDGTTARDDVPVTVPSR